MQTGTFITIMGNQALLVIEDDQHNQVGYLINDLTTIRIFLDTHLKEKADRQKIMRSALATRIPEKSGRKTIQFSQPALVIWLALVDRTLEAFKIQDPLPDVPDGFVCIAVADQEGCLLFGFCDPHGKHWMLIIDSLAGFHLALKKELSWLPQEERDFYLQLFEGTFKPIDGLLNTEYTTIEGEFCQYLNTGSAWLDDFESLTEEVKAEEEIEGLFNLPVTPEG